MGNEVQLLIESIPVHVIVTTPSGEVETVNRPTLEYFGKTLEELKGWKTPDIVHPDDLQHTIAEQQKGLETGRVQRREPPPPRGWHLPLVQRPWVALS